MFVNFYNTPSIKSLEDDSLTEDQSLRSLKAFAKASEEMNRSHEFDQLIINDNFTAPCIGKELVNNLFCLKMKIGLFFGSFNFFHVGHKIIILFGGVF